MLSEEEQLVLEFLKASPKAWFAPAEIARKASVRDYRKDPQWAAPALQRLFQARRIECDPSGHYRYVDLEAREKERQARMRRRLED